MIKVHPTVYRLLWIAVATLGALMLGPAILLGVLALVSPDTANANDSTSWYIIAGGAVFGLIILLYALRRLLWPLTPPPPAP